LVGIVIKFGKCVTWSSLGLALKFLPPLGFYSLIGGIRVLGVPLRSLSFTSFFLQEALDNDVQHMDALLKLGDL
jgi:hypothetical protein